MSITAIAYILPNGRQEVIEITDINQEDELWFKEHDAKLSVEQLSTGHMAVYADIGLGEDNEALEISFNRSCQETLAALRKQCEYMLKGV